MKFEPVKITDIAKALGLSSATVSRAFRDSHEISEKTKKKVMDYARSVNYRPNPVAQNLKDKRSRALGVVVAEIANSFYSQIIDGIESAAHAKGYHVIIAQSHELLEKEIDAVNYLASRSVDGILISLSGESEHIDHLTNLHDKGMPYVFFDRVTDQIDTFQITSDNFSGAKQATLHLLDQGFERVAFLGGTAHLSITRERLNGYLAAHGERNTGPDKNLIRFCPVGGLQYYEVETAMQQFMSAPTPPDALLACSDKLTTNIFRYCREQRIAIPQQLALIGFSNLDLTEYLEPPLSIIRQPAFEMGETAALMMIRLLEAPYPLNDFESKVLPPDCVLRRSSIRLV
ncbi:LacI family DNA-binding transcriptional regulator [Pedobacter sp. SYP-B3415]|uniref:LacI family DNA-binding transcriptional regulator n=1 Tax=Pedobacter sp. SYP-B3415 TaxID=2496641 RepID=UPI00101BECA9|nr:LacI family DNA-binding transcriptional regulator [Pedobacter sp. SYP-B3415]